MVAPITGTAGLQVIVGTAPVNMLKDPAAAVNVPLLVSSYKEAVEAVGYLPDFANYTLCECISANFSVVGIAPMVLINVLDPAKHKIAITGGTVQVNDGVAVLEETGVLLEGLTVKSGSTTLTAGTDYTTTWNDDGTLNIVVLSTGAGKEATSLTVTGNKIDPSKVTAADIVGGVDSSTGKETGLEVVRQVYPKLSMTPGILLAPRFSKDATVAAALQAKTKSINSVFGAVCVVDIDSSNTGATKYTAVKTTKEAQAVSDPNAYAVWPFAKVGNTVYSGSALAAALTAYTDATTGATVLSLMNEGALDKLPTLVDMLFGKMGGSLGEVSALALLLGLVFMLWKKIITWQIPVSILLTVFVFTGIMHLVNPVQYASPFVHLLSGGLMLGAIFMATDYVTSPMSKNGMLVYGVGIGILTTVIRLFGSYPEGMSFAILIMNAFTPLINSYIKPKHFGGK